MVQKFEGDVVGPVEHYCNAPMTSACKSIHILGIGNLGKLVAHSLAASKSAPKVTLLFHRPDLVNQWDEAGRRIDVVSKGFSDPRNSFDIERTFDSTVKHNGPISYLIAATKTYATTEALRPLRHRLNHDSTILFLQNGMGTVEEVTKSLFPVPAARPLYLAGIVNHGVYNTGPFSIVHAGQANMSVGMVCLADDPQASKRILECGQSEYLLRCLREAPALSASVVSQAHLLQIQLEKLVVNSIINPLTAIFDCFNGELFKHLPIRVLIQSLIVELSAVIQSIVASSVAESADTEVPSQFLAQALGKTVSDVAAKTAQNISSMRQDMRAGKRTEIDYINGYIIARGSEMGLDCCMNRKLVDLVHERRTISVDQTPEFFPDLGLE